MSPTAVTTEQVNQSPAWPQSPVVTIHYDDDSWEDIRWEGTGKLYSERPGSRVKIIDLPGKKGIRIRPLTTKNVAFKKITFDHGVIPTTGTRIEGGENCYIPDNPKARRDKLSSSSHVLHRSEMLTILFTHAQKDLQEPHAHARANMLALIESTTHLASIKKNQRAMRFLRLFDDKKRPQNEPDGLGQDYGWLLRHWQHTMGGESREGWFEGVCPRGAGGQTNWSYETILFLVYNYLLHPRADLWYLIVEQTIRHCDFGRVLEGKDQGLAEYEKGDTHHGQNFPPTIAKCWSRGPAIVNALMGGHPVIQTALDEMVAWLKRSNAKLIWQGFWGARIGARYLDELLLFWLLDKDGNADLRAKAVEHMREAKKWLDPVYGLWINIPSPHNTSPWMNSQFIQKMFQWEEHSAGIIGEAGWTIDEVLDVGENILHHGITRDVGGKPLFMYRMIHQPIAPRSMHITAFAIPMVRYMAAYSSKYLNIWVELRDFFNEYMGSGNGDIQSGKPRGLNPIDYRFPPEGPAWGQKVLQFYLIAFI